MENLDPETLERMVYDMYLDDFLMMSDSDLLLEAEAMEIEITVDESL